MSTVFSSFRYYSLRSEVGQLSCTDNLHECEPSPNKDETAFGSDLFCYPSRIAQDKYEETQVRTQ